MSDQFWGSGGQIIKTPPKREVFFCVGCPRSGTTLLQIILDSHPNIAIPPETHIFKRFPPKHYGSLKHPENLSRLVRDLLRDDHVKEMRLDIGHSEFCERVEALSMRGVVSLLFGLYAEKEGTIRCGEKTPQHALHLEEIWQHFPDAKFVNVVRDGRDVAASCKNTIVGPNSIYGVAKEWRRYILAFEEFKSTAGKAGFIEVRYEDLVSDPDKEIKRLLGFLGEDIVGTSRSVLDTERRQDYLDTDWHMHSLKDPISAKKVGAFRKAFSHREIEIFESVAGDALRLRGYSLMTSGTAQVKWHELCRFAFQDNFVRYYRKYMRPLSLQKSWRLFRRETQFWMRSVYRPWQVRR